MQEFRCRVVVDVLGVDAFDKAQFVGNRAEVGQRITYPRAALAMLSE